MAILSERPSHLAALDTAREDLYERFRMELAQRVVCRIAAIFRERHPVFATFEGYHGLVGGSIDYTKMQQRPECVMEIVSLIHDAITKLESSSPHPQEGVSPVE